VSEANRAVRPRAPRVAELVAAEIRSRILSGRLKDGSELPSQDRLSEVYGISKAALREALRILESERLVTVRRGKVGGIIVHTPSTSAAAYALGLVLHANEVPVGDLTSAMAFIRGACTELCAGRSDRLTAVLPSLVRAAQQADQAQGLHPDDYVLAEHSFHTTIIATCGNSTMTAVGGLIEDLMLMQQRQYLIVANSLGFGPNAELRRFDATSRATIIESIRDGDSVRAAAEMRTFILERSRFYSIPFISEPIVVPADSRVRPLSNLPESAADTG
jgi:GntR family transcriptional regulator, transcriptional repressor for pyruvate dehydrogenase complex